MDQFEYVMVLVSIIVGLGIAHILLGVGGIIDRLSGHGRHLRVSIAHGSWLVATFVWMVLFWWWEYRFGLLATQWTVGLYFFLVLYAVVLFLLAVVLVPRSWDGVEDLADYLIARRAWFFSILLIATALDVLDSYLKGGWTYVADTGAWTWAFWLLTIPVCAVGIRSRNKRHHAILAVAYLLWQVAVGFETLPRLGF